MDDIEIAIGDAAIYDQIEYMGLIAGGLVNGGRFEYRNRSDQRVEAY